jgi:hypothetical protein
MMPDEATPEPISTQNNTGPFMVTEGPRERVLSWFRIGIALILGVLLVGDIALYSLYQALRSQVEAHEHRIERQDKLITDMLSTNENAVKLEAITGKVDNIEIRVQELTTAVKEEAAGNAETTPSEESKDSEKK